MTRITGPAPRVLVIEDDDDSRTVLGHLLTAEGYQLTDARNGLEGLRAARACRPDVILLDVQMPVMDGFAFRRHQSADRELIGIPVICVSALDGVCLQSRALGDVQFVRKPIDFDKLLGAIRHATAGFTSVRSRALSATYRTA